MEIINNTSIAEAQKQDAIDSMIQMTDVAEKENAAEIFARSKRIFRCRGKYYGQ